MVIKTPPGSWPKGKPPQYVHDYVDWLLTPQDLRDPPSKAKWAEKHGFSKDTLYDWDKDDRVKWIIQDRADELNLSPVNLQQVLSAMFKKAAAGDTTAAKLYMEHYDKIRPRKAPEPVGLESLSDEELQEKLREHLADE